MSSTATDWRPVTNGWPHDMPIEKRCPIHPSPASDCDLCQDQLKMRRPLTCRQAYERYCQTEGLDPEHEVGWGAYKAAWEDAGGEPDPEPVEQAWLDYMLAQGYSDGAFSRDEWHTLKEFWRAGFDAHATGRYS